MGSIHAPLALASRNNDKTPAFEDWGFAFKKTLAMTYSCMA
jgi:hypothetical protein